MSSPDDEALRDLPWPEPVPPPPELTASIRARCTADLEPKRSLSAGSRAAVSFGLWLLAALGIAVLEGLNENHSARALVLGAIGWATVMGAVLFVGFAKPPGRRASRNARLALAVVIPVAFFAYLGLSGTEWMPFAGFLDTGGHALKCGMMSLGIGALGTLSILFVWRRTDPFTPGISASLAGLLGGVAGAVAIGLVCPSGETWHLWLGHGAAVVALVALSALVGRRWLTP